MRLLLASRISLLAVLMAPASLMAQSDSALISLLTRRPLSFGDSSYSNFKCNTFTANAEMLLPWYYKQGYRDSIDMVIELIDRKCSHNRFSEVRTLLAIQDGQFRDDESFAVQIEFCIDNYEPFPLAGDVICSGWEWDAMLDFDKFQKNLAADLSEKTDSNSTAHAFCCYHAGRLDYVLRRLRKGDFSDSKLGESYRRAVKRVMNSLYKSRYNFSFNLGLLSPQGANNILGRKLELGGQAGQRWRRIGFDLTLTLRLLRSASPYSVMCGSELRSTHHYVGWLAGADFTFEPIRYSRFSFENFIGLAVDGFEAVSGSAGKSINSLAISLGITARVFVNQHRSRYLGLQVRHNFTKYGSGGGTDLSGNTLSLNLVYGYLGDYSYRISKADALHLYD